MISEMADIKRKMLEPITFEESEKLAERLKELEGDFKNLNVATTKFKANISFIGVNEGLQAR
jgi:hypothetical protein